MRATGPIDSLTHQPVQGRKRQGGIRFGEMERDALLAHGTSFLLQDRLMDCSDRSVVGPFYMHILECRYLVRQNRTLKVFCGNCEKCQYHVAVASECDRKYPGYGFCDEWKIAFELPYLIRNAPV